MKTMRTDLEIDIRAVEIPAYAHFPATTLHEARACGGLVTSGLCRTVEEAQRRVEAYGRGDVPATEAPDYQANTREMMRARAKLEHMAIRDGGACKRAIDAALRAGLHTVEWAIASRYLVAGWI